MMIRGSIQEDITLVNIYAANIRTPTYVKQLSTNIRGESDSNTLIVGDFNTPLTPMDRPSGQEINKKTVDLNDT